MQPLSHSTIHKGCLLIATPDIEGGIFFRSVVLICEHNSTGSFGLVINKRLDIELPNDILNLDQLLNPHVGIRAGGPVQTNQMMLIHDCKEPQKPQQLLTITDEIFLGGDLHFLQDAITQKEGLHILLCFGYAGWSSGQLERELLDGHWFAHPATKHHLFEIAPEMLWKQILREMGGKHAVLSLIPEDLTLN